MEEGRVGGRGIEVGAEAVLQSEKRSFSIVALTCYTHMGNYYHLLGIHYPNCNTNLQLQLAPVTHSILIYTIALTNTY